MFLLNINDSTALTAYLHKKEWLPTHETVLSIEIPGAGNMNVVVRVRTTERNFIVKQALPFVAKYPQVAAPRERAGVEAAFYQEIDFAPEIQAYLPHLLGYDAENQVIVLEDLGTGSDFTRIYQPNENITPDEALVFTDFLSELHQYQSSRNFPDNLAMRRLNHEHLFVFPFTNETGFDLDTVQLGLQALAQPIRANSTLKNKLLRLGEMYLSPGKSLLHGDFYPGSWLKTGEVCRVIDPEFCFWGRPEYDLGVMLAHLHLAQTNHTIIALVSGNYQRPNGFDETLSEAFMGMEILRRLLGLAQLPLSLSLEEKEALLNDAVRRLV